MFRRTSKPIWEMYFQVELKRNKEHPNVVFFQKQELNPTSYKWVQEAT